MRKRDALVFVTSGVVTWVVVRRITRNAREECQQEIHRIETETIAMWIAYQKVVADIRRGKYVNSGHTEAMVDFEFEKIVAIEGDSR